MLPPHFSRPSYTPASGVGEGGAQGGQLPPPLLDMIAP